MGLVLGFGFARIECRAREADTTEGQQVFHQSVKWCGQTACSALHPRRDSALRRKPDQSSLQRERCLRYHQDDQSQQGEQHGQAQEDKLQCAVTLEGAKEHEQGEDTPQAQVNAQQAFAASAVPILGISRMATVVSQKEP